MRIRSKVFVSVLPMLLWFMCAAYFEWHWHGVDAMDDTAMGFGWVLIYRFGLLVALLLSILFSVFFYVRRNR
jgi:hypothetical protein